MGRGRHAADNAVPVPDEIAFSAAARNLPIVSADPYLNECLVNYWEAALARRSSRQNSIRAAVENAILPLLPHGKARVGKVSEGLGRQFSDLVSAA